MKNTFQQFRSLCILLLSITFLITASCSKNDDNDPAQGTTGTVAGKVTTPAGKNVPAATVKSGNYVTKTNQKGEFVLTLPTGINNLVIQTGNGRIFKTILPVNVLAGQNTILPLAQTVLKQ